MTVTKIPTDTFSDMELKCMKTYNERQYRQALASKADALGYHGVAKVCKASGVCRDTVYRGLHELKSDLNNSFPEGRTRAAGGGRKSILVKHPEYLTLFDEIADQNKAGLPQDDSVVWLTISVSDIVDIFKERGIDVKPHTVRQMKKKRGFRERSFTKSLTLKDVKDRNAQFEKIKSITAECENAGIPVISIDTKKKELIGNFKRDGKVSCKGQPRAYDHDFKSFAKGQIVPHGIYDIASNTGFLTIGDSHDTSEFVCDNITRVWKDYLQWRYPNAHTICILADGGGSNSSSHHIFKQELMKLASTLGLNILMVHYPPYCSKYNPIEHRMFGPLTRSWSGAPLTSMENARLRAETTKTQKGLTIIATINQRTYETKRPLHESYESEKCRRIVFDDRLPKWNYLVKCN